MASEIRVNKIENRSGLGTVTFADTGVDLAGIVTATTFSGSGASLTHLPAANLTGTASAINGSNITNLPAANLTGTASAINGSNITHLAAANLTGTASAINGSNITNLPAANLTGTLSAVSAVNLTNIPAANIVGLATAGFERSGGFGAYVKLTSASGSSGGSAINIDSLDVSTYKAFEIFLTMQPTNDNVNLYVRFMTANGTITASNYVNWKEALTPTNNVSHKASGSVDLIEPAENIGGNSEENVFFHGVMHVATSNDPDGLARQNNRIEYDTNYMRYDPAHWSTRGVAHYSNDTTTYVNGISFYFSSGNIDEYMYTVYGIKR